MMSGNMIFYSSKYCQMTMENLVMFEMFSQSDFYKNGK